MPDLVLRPSRRAFLGGAAGAGILLAAPRIARAAPMMESLTLYGPPAGPSITLAHAVAAGKLAGIAGTAAFAPWKDPDELRAGLSSGQMQVVVMPTQAAANLYNRGMGVRLVDVLTDGLVYAMTLAEGVARIEDLGARRVAMPFRNDTPDILTRRLVELAGVRDAEILAAGTPVEAAQMMALGRAEVAILPEPAATMIRQRAGMIGKTVHRAFSLNDEWGRLTGLPPSLAQAGLGVTADFDAAHPEAVDAIQAALAEATAEVNADPEKAAPAAARALDMKPGVIAASIPFSHLVATPASVARPALEGVLAEVMKVDPAILGGRLPDDGFYRL